MIVAFLQGIVAKLGKRADINTTTATFWLHFFLTRALRRYHLTLRLSPRLISSHPVIQHRLHQKTVPITRLRTPLRLIIQPIRPKVPASTVDLRALPIPAAQQRQRLRPVPARAAVVESLPLAHAQRVRDLVQRRALRLVRGVGAEAQVAVVVRLGGRHARRVVDADGLGDGRREALVAGHGRGHGGVDARVGGGLVGGGVRGALEGPGYGCCGGGEEG